MLFTADEVGSDDMEAVLEFSAREAAQSSTVASSSMAVNGSHPYSGRQGLNGRLSELDSELKDVDEQIERLRELRSQIIAERNRVNEKVKTMQGAPRLSASNSLASARPSGKALQAGSINYMTEVFEWSGELKARMREVFGIQNFRLCQEGVCNANMDGRDIVCIMPTGGGKSLTYQLPALLNPGTTLVISPLISLITDQILHLREFGVEAVMLMGSTSKEESRDIYSRLAAAANSKNRNGMAGPEIKFCYVTPEKIAASKSFTSMLEKLANAGKLSRIVIDEAHCVSQLGHDFRPDYKKLSILRQLFPRVPILALSATCPPKVLKDLLTTLRLKPIVSGTAATADGTIYFSAPLYRKNLHYTVVPKPSSASGVIKAMTKYILDHHHNDSGIVYCMSKKDTETVAQGLAEGKIRSGVYHADVHDRTKAELHERWRRGDVKVVCATIAFGLGIDKGDVRFVLHHSVGLRCIKGIDINIFLRCLNLWKATIRHVYRAASHPLILTKSLLNQESGRAGRDGNDSDCILYFRPQDASRLSALVCGELEGQAKLQDMLRFAMDVEECRKLQFARYFSMSASLSMSAWGTAETDAHARCGHCDNCKRPPEAMERRDVTLPAWQILRVSQVIERMSGRVTMGMLADLVRGAGGGSFGAVVGGRGRGKGKGGAKEKIGLDLDEIAGGKVQLGREETEILIVQLFLSGHLGESFHSTAYSINVYVTPGPGALRITRYSREDVESGRGQRIQVTFLRKGKDAAKKNERSTKTGDEEASRAYSSGAKGKKRKRGEESFEDEVDDPIVNDDDGMSLYADDDDIAADRDEREVAKANTSYTSHNVASKIRQRSESEGWTFTMSNGTPVSAAIPSKQGRGKFKPAIAGSAKLNGSTSLSNASRTRTPLTTVNRSMDNGVIEIESDSD
ncbi:hypothetical protein ACEPAI_3099 [Sanghuangporus weigelae]